MYIAIGDSLRQSARGEPFVPHKLIRKAVIPAAGFGTRFLPATKASPKEMMPIVDKPVIQYVVEEAVASGITDIIIITGSNKRPIEDHFDYNFELEHTLLEQGRMEQFEEIRRISDMARFIYVRQKEPLGNGHAVLCAREVIGNEPFAVLWGDDLVDSKVPCLKQLLKIYERYRNPVMAAIRVPKDRISDYGVIDGTPIEDRVWQVKSLVEKPTAETAPSDVAIVKEYILTPDIFDILADLKPGQKGEIWLTDAINILAKQRNVYAYEFEGERYDTGDKLGFLKATIHYALKHESLNNDFRAYLSSLDLNGEREKQATK